MLTIVRRYDFSLRRRVSGTPRLAGVLTVVLGGAGLFLLAAGGPAQTADEQSIRRIVWGSQVAQQTLIQTPPRYRGGAALPAAEMQRLKDAIASGLQKFYTGERLSQLTSVMQENAGWLQTGATVEFGGGVDTITFKSVEIQGDHAQARGEVVEWLYGGQKDAKGLLRMSRPSGPIEFNDHLVKTVDGWRIDAESDTFPNGGP